MWGCVPKNFEKICYSDRLREVWDTTYVAADTSYIVFYEDSYHKIGITEQTPTKYRHRFAISMPRYNPLTAGDTLWMKLPGYTSTIQYVSNIGLFLYNWFSAGNISYGERYAVKEYHLH
jgi:hypothetical protein